MNTQLRVLIVEDSESDARLIARRLQKAGYDLVYDRVETAEAMKVTLAQQDWDLIIADYNLPRFSGPAALELFQANGRDVPFIVVSAAIGEDKAVTMMKAGAHDYVMKNNLARLVPAVERELREAEGRRKRREAEDDLIKSEAILRTVLKGSPSGIGLVVHRVFHWVNDKLLNLTGYTREELIGQKSRILYFSEAEYKRVGNVTGAQIQKNGWAEVETQWRRKDGSRMEIHVSTVAVAPGDLSAGVVFTAMDITERKQAEAKLRKSEEKYRLVFENVPLGIMHYDQTSAITDCNAKFAEIIGAPKERFIGFNMLRQVRDDQMRAAAAASLRGKVGLYEGDYLSVTAGKLTPVRAIYQPISTPDGLVLGGVAIFEDITERKLSQDRIQDLNILLRAIKDINESLLRVKSEEELFQRTCDLLLTVPYIRFCWIGLVEQESVEVNPVAWAGAEDGYLSTIKVTWDDSALGQGPTGEGLRTGKPVVRGRIATDPAPNPWRQEALKRGYQSSISLPLIHEGLVVGILKVYSGVPDIFGDEKIDFLNQVAGDIAVGVKSLRLEQGLEQSLGQLKRLIHQTVETMGSIVETRDPYTAGHQQNVAHLAGAIAAEMGLDADRLQGLRVAGLLHDIGKMLVPAEILSKPGKLSEMEFDLIKAHSLVGADILGKIDFPWPVAQIVLQHHERLDGSGYPLGLAADDIILEARILAVADVVEAMASHRPYRSALGIDAALEEITRHKHKFYDPEVVDSCVTLFIERRFYFDPTSNS